MLKLLSFCKRAVGFLPQPAGDLFVEGFQLFCELWRERKHEKRVEPALTFVERTRTLFEGLGALSPAIQTVVSLVIDTVLAFYRLWCHVRRGPDSEVADVENIAAGYGNKAYSV